MKRSFVFIICLLMYFIGVSQSHTYNACCRYSKGNVKGDCSCPGCEKDKQDEIKASQEETKQQKAKAAAEQAIKDAADKKAKEDAEQKKITDQKLKDENKITIGNPNSEKEPAKNLVMANNITDKTVMIAFKRSRDRGYEDTLGNIIFYTIRDNIIQQGFEDSWHGSIGTFDNRSYLYSFPKNRGIIEFTYGFGGITPSGISRFVKSYADIVYPNGKREFNDEKIASILHLIDNWFMIKKRLTRESDENIECLYNIKTKEIIELPRVSLEQYQSAQFVPIFKGTVYKVFNEKPYFFGERLYNESVEFKKALIEKYPDKVTEKLLEENIMGIVIGSNSSLFYINKGEVNKFKIAYLTKDGKLIYK